MRRLYMLNLILAMGAILAVLMINFRAVDAASPATHTEATVAVAIQNFAFSPKMLVVSPGTTVTWTNKDDAPHTVTSDSGAWTDSGNLTTNQSFSHTFTKAGTYNYHCAIHPFMTATVQVGGTAPAGGSSSSGSKVPAMGNMGMMGPSVKVAQMGWYGYYDAHRVVYLPTDTSSMAEAMRDHINYAPGLVKAVSLASKIYLVTNGKYAARGAVFGSQPGESDYTPLWQEVTVTWKNIANAVPLGSDNQINALAKSGMLSLKQTGTVLNCPIVNVHPSGM